MAGPFVSNPMDFPNLVVKGAPINADTLMLYDSVAALVKQCTVGSLPFAPLGGSGSAIVNTATQAMVIDTTYYVIYAGGVCTLTLPLAAASPLNSFVTVIGIGAISNPYVVGQNALQSMQFGSVVTTTGVTGSLTAGNKFYSLSLFCADTAGTGLAWTARNVIGSFTGA